MVWVDKWRLKKTYLIALESRWGLNDPYNDYLSRISKGIMGMDHLITTKSWVSLLRDCLFERRILSSAQLKLISTYRIINTNLHYS